MRTISIGGAFEAAGSWALGEMRSIESTRLYLHLANGWLDEEYQRTMAVIDGRLS